VDHTIQDELNVNVGKRKKMVAFVSGSPLMKKARGWVVGHGFHFVVHKCACFIECRSALGKVISMAINKCIQQGLEAEVVHGKADRSLTQTEAYDLEIEGMYVAAVFEFEGMSFPLLDELEVTVPIYSESGFIDRDMLLSNAILSICKSAERRGLCPPLSSTLGGASNFAPPRDSSLGVADYQVSTLVLFGDGGPANQPHVVQPYDDLFDTSVLDKSGDA
nr:hypothetical protein [Tanacetum cinerariifolium]